MATEQLLVHLPDDLVRQFKRSVQPLPQSAFVQKLLEQALPPVQGDDDPIYQAAMAVERCVPRRRDGRMGRSDRWRWSGRCAFAEAAPLNGTRTSLRAGRGR